MDDRIKYWRYLKCSSVFSSIFFYDFLDFYVGRNKKKINLLISKPDKTKSIHFMLVLSSRGSITYFVALLVDEI